MIFFIGSTLDGFKMYLSYVLSYAYYTNQPFLIIMATPSSNSTRCSAGDYVLMKSGPLLAGDIVAAWMGEPERTAEEIRAARSFLGLDSTNSNNIMRGAMGNKRIIDLAGPEGNCFFLLAVADLLATKHGKDGFNIRSRMCSSDYFNFLDEFTSEFKDYVCLINKPRKRRTPETR